MKKLLSALLVTFTLTLSLPKPEAKAAVVVGSGLCAVHANGWCAVDLFVITPAIALPGIIIGTVVGVSMSTSLGYWIMGAGVVLDVETTQSTLDQSLAEKFSFIDDQEVIHELSSGLLNRFSKKQDLLIATLDEASVGKILEPTDLNEEQIMTVVKDLN